MVQADIQYLLTYVEVAKGAKRNDLRYWTTRQVGVYQKYSRSDDCGFCILLHPQQQSVAQRRVDGLGVHRESQPGNCFGVLYDVHLIVISSYLRNWQTYLTVLNNTFEDIVSSEPYFSHSGSGLSNFVRSLFVLAGKTSSYNPMGQLRRL